MSHFELCAQTIVNDVIEVTKYKSKLTGLSVVVADIEGPLVEGHFVLATEAHDDDGLPHTLEHLIFLGSEDYPYKGVLDLSANRCLASGTNAWTDTDHTCYEMTTAGKQGFLTLLPIYLDHILYPTLTDSAFLTEVHHITNEGDDGGIVYCEVQGRENSGESRAHLALVRAAYPNSGYSAETGGIMENLRTSTNNEKVRKYHAEFYRPENLTIIVTGKVEAREVFNALEPIEKKIKSKGDLGAFEKPWITPVAPLKQSQNLKIAYASDEEDCGLVYIGFRGPNCKEQYQVLAACNILLRYFTDTSVSPIPKECVEIDDPYASSVSYSIIENLESLLYFIFDNVPMEKIDHVLDKLKEILQKFVQGEEKFDMERMKYIIENEIQDSISNLEGSPHESIAFLVIGDVLYGRNEEDFSNRLNAIKQLEYYLSASEEFWIDLLRKFIVNGHYICVQAVPSIKEQKRMAKEEMERKKKQCALLGPDGLKKKGEELANAMKINETPVPDGILSSIPIPTGEDINFHYRKIYKSSNPEKSHTCFDFKDFPTYTEVYDIHTNFIYTILSMNTDDLKDKLRPYLPLLLELLLESPIRQKDGSLIPYQEIVAALERDTVAIGAKLGLESTSAFSCGPFSQTAILFLQIELSKYETCVEWIKKLFFSTEFTVERVKVCASKMYNGIAQAKRKGSSVVQNLLKAMYFKNESNVYATSILRQHKFLGNILEYLNDNEKSNQVLNDLYETRKIITLQTNIGLHIAANLAKMSQQNINLSKSWKQVFTCTEEDSKLRLRITPDHEIMNHNGNKSEIKGTVVGLGCVESSFLFHACPSLRSFTHEDLPSLMLFIQYMTQLEGPLWRQIRGQGLSYDYCIMPRPNEGLLCFTLYKATNVVSAFKETKRILETQLSNKDFERNLLESARSSLIFEIIEREKSVGSLVIQGLLGTFKNTPDDYNQILVMAIKNVTDEKLKEVGKKYLISLFSDTAKVAVVCHPDKVNEIVNAFDLMDIKLTPAITLEESILAK